MEAAHQGKPIRVFPVPRGVVFAKIDAQNGKLATPETEKVFYESFKEGTAPTEYSTRKTNLKREKIL